MNETYEIEIKSPLIRAGIIIRTRVSRKYLVPVLNDVLNQVREFNKQQENKQREKK